VIFVTLNAGKNVIGIGIYQQLNLANAGGNVQEIKKLNFFL